VTGTEEITMQNEQTRLISNILGALGGLLLAGGVFLPWVSSGGKHFSGIAEAGNAAWWFIALGALAFIYSLYGLVRKTKNIIGYFVAGLLAGWLLLYRYVLLRSMISKACFVTILIEIGFGICVVGASLLIISAFVGRGKKLPKSAEGDSV
jgi:hypothetical protein